MKPIKGGKHPDKKKNGSNNSSDELLKMMAQMLKGSNKKPLPNTTGISYSGMLLQLIKPYQQKTDPLPVQELEFLLDLGISAWNLAVYKSKNDFLYQSYLQAIKIAAAYDKATEKLLMKLVADKEKFFKEHNDRLLEDFEITEDNKGKSMVNVISKPFDSMLYESLLSDDFEGNPFESADADNDDEFILDEEEDDLPDYVLPVVNRNVLVVNKQQPFLDWLRKLYFPEQPPTVRIEPNIYLMPEYESDKEVNKYLKQHFDRIFCSELWEWDMDEKNWPANRTWKMFSDWFEVKTQCIVYDMANYPLERD